MSPKNVEHHSTNNAVVPRVLMGLGIVLVLGSVLILGKIFFPVIREELKYAFLHPDKNAQVVVPKDNTPVTKGVIVPVDPFFSVIIPKIGANSRVITNVDPFNAKEYQWQLSKGVAHAQGTVNPGEKGNIFLFAHSAGNFYEANQYNAVFYLLNKLEKNDFIYLSYYKTVFKYQVTEIRIVNANEINYIKSAPIKADETVTLMTCWPAGTTLKRLLVIAKRV